MKEMRIPVLDINCSTFVLTTWQLAGPFDVVRLRWRTNTAVQASFTALIRCVNNARKALRSGRRRCERLVLLVQVFELATFRFIQATLL